MIRYLSLQDIVDFGFSAVFYGRFIFVHMFHMCMKEFGKVLVIDMYAN